MLTMFPLMPVREFLGNNLVFLLDFRTLFRSKTNVQRIEWKIFANYPQQQFSLDHREQYQLWKK